MALIFVLAAGCKNDCPTCQDPEDTSVEDDVTDTSTEEVIDDGPDGEPGPCTDDDACENGVYCDGVEVCMDGECQPGRVLSLAWTGRNHGLVWDARVAGMDHLYFAEIDATGDLALEPTRMTDESHPSIEPALIWNGSHYAVTWSRDLGALSEIYFNRFYGWNVTESQEDARVSTLQEASSNPKMAWNGTSLGIVWDNFDEDEWQSNLHFDILTPSGVPMLGGVVLAEQDVPADLPPDIVWTGTDFIVVYSQESRLAHTVIDTAGVTMIGETFLTTSPSGVIQWPSVVWTGTEALVAWIDGDMPDPIVLTTTFVTGTVPSATPTLIDYGGYSSLVLGETGAGIVWEYLDSIKFNCLDLDGIPTASEMMITDHSHVVEYPSAAWTGSDYVVVWQDDREGIDDIWFRSVQSDCSSMGPDIRLTAGEGSARDPEVVRR